MAGAADGGPAWDGDSRAAARLVAASSRGDGASLVHRAGAEIKLAPGWKTYWRYPGDSGIPPQFDFAASENVKSATVLWPAPQRFTDADGSIIGYKNHVLFPLHVVPRDPSQPVTLRIALDYAICEKVCIPAHAKAEIVLGKEAGPGEAAVAAAEARVPVRTALGAEGALAIKAARREDGTPARVLVDVAAPPGSPVTLFAEGPRADWALPLPEPIPGAAPGMQRFAFALDGLPSGATAAQAALTLTAVSGDRAIESVLRLD
ncbi:MAG: protein-disulfide reductase DsbD domain-containing protein [Pseudorhodoplanes sp.]